LSVLLCLVLCVSFKINDQGKETMMMGRKGFFFVLKFPFFLRNPFSSSAFSPSLVIFCWRSVQKETRKPEPHHHHYLLFSNFFLRALRMRMRMMGSLYLNFGAIPCSLHYYPWPKEGKPSSCVQKAPCFYSSFTRRMNFIPSQ